MGDSRKRLMSGGALNGISACSAAERGVSTSVSSRVPLWMTRSASGFPAAPRSICAVNDLPSTVPRMRGAPRCQLLQMA